MPIFEYVCQKCDHRFETLVRASSPPACPQCNSKKLEKQYSTFASTGIGASYNAAYPNAARAAIGAPPVPPAPTKSRSKGKKS